MTTERGLDQKPRGRTLPGVLGDYFVHTLRTETVSTTSSHGFLAKLIRIDTDIKLSHGQVLRC